MKVLITGGSGFIGTDDLVNASFAALGSMILKQKTRFENTPYMAYFRSQPPYMGQPCFEQ